MKQVVKDEGHSCSTNEMAPERSRPTLGKPISESLTLSLILETNPNAIIYRTMSQPGDRTMGKCP